MKTVKLNLSDNQLSKIRNGHPVQIKPEMVGSGVPVALNDSNYQKLGKAYNGNKSARINLSNDEIQGGGLKKLKKGFNKAKKKVQKTSNQIAKGSNKVNKFVNDADKIIQKVDKGVDRFEFIGDLGIPYVSPAYAALDAGTDALAEGSSRAKKLSNATNNTIQKSNKFVQKPSIGAFDKAVTSGEETYNTYQGSGVNPYVPRRLRQSKSGGSFRPVGGSFKTVGRGVKLDTTETNFVNPNHNSFNPVHPESYSEVMGKKGKGLKKCPHCGR